MSEMIVQHGDIEGIARMVASMDAELAALRARAEKAEAEVERLRAEVGRVAREAATRGINEGARSRKIDAQAIDDIVQKAVDATIDAARRSE